MNRFLVQNISQIYKGLQYELEKKMKDYDLDKGLYIYLTHLLINGEMNQFSLAKAVNRDQAPTARAVKRLISMGYLVRQTDDSDRRANQLSTTPKAEVIKESIVKIINDCENDILKNLTLEEQQIFSDLCTKVSSTMIKEP